MRKHYGEENIVLKHVIFSLFFFVLLFNSPNLQGQIPINGFCKYESFETEPGFHNFFTLNFNEDSYTDIVLYSGGKKMAVSSGEVNGSFAKPRINLFRKEINGLHQINTQTGKPVYIFISRMNRKIGILEFSKYGFSKVVSEIKFEYYPDNISIADIDKDGQEELLVYGSSFNGLSILKISNNTISASGIFEGRLFSHAFFIDLNNDGYPDIAAIDLLENSLKFFYNIDGNFEEIREFKLSDKISLIQPYDINLDGYDDIIYVTKNRINIVFGDSVSSYLSTARITVKLNPDKIIISDLNHDGHYDISYLNKNSSKVFVLFAKDEKNYFPEVNYLSKENLTDIIPYYSKYIHGFLALSSSGKLYMVNNLRVIRDNTKLIAGANPSIVTFFDAGKDKIQDLCYYDKEERTINLLIRNNAGIPSKFYSYNLLEDHTEIQIDDKDSEIKTIYCYSKGKRLIEILIVDLSSGLVKKEMVYSGGAIYDVWIDRNEDQARAKIYVLTNKAGNLSLSVYSYKDFRYNQANSPVYASNTLNARIAFGNPISIFFWQKSEGAYIFKKINLSRDLKTEKVEFKYSLPFEENITVTSYVNNIYNDEKRNALNFVKDNKNLFALLTTESGYFKVDLGNHFPAYESINELNMFFGEQRFNGLNKLFFYNSLSNSIERIDILKQKRILFTTKLIDSINPNSYFIKNLNFKKYHLVYADRSENCITIREIL